MIPITAAHYVVSIGKRYYDPTDIISNSTSYQGIAWAYHTGNTRSTIAPGDCTSISSSAIVPGLTSHYVMTII
ncbi:hypothetical protein GCM10023091_00040 [Ravibacter arvi]|uniref:Uncharacterized protein n=1 Tax=Ravibacter arvi TaxID=2051041 RepID=A0ABP8LK74_9BACT